MNKDFIRTTQQPNRNFDNKFLKPEPITREFLNQSKLIIKAFGLSTLTPKFFNITDQDKLLREQEAREDGNKNKMQSAFSLPVFDVLTLGAKDYETLDREQISVLEFSLGIALIEASRPKNIIWTQVQGRDGEIPEYISDGNWDITIRGVVSSNAQDVFPEEAFKALIEFCNIPEEISVGSEYLDMLGVTDIIITNRDFKQEEGQRNVQRFTIYARSYEPFEINKKKN